MLAFVWIVAIFLVQMGRTPASSMDLTCPADIGTCGDDVVWITGEIEKGDYRKFVAELKRRGPVVKTVILARSPGGFVVDAVKIGRLIRLLRIATSVGWAVPDAPDNLTVYYPAAAIATPAANATDSKSWSVPTMKALQAICESACVEIWLAGYPRLGYAFLAVHAPQVDVSQYEWITMDRIAEFYRRAHVFLRNYQLEMGAPQADWDVTQTVTIDSSTFLTFPYIEEKLLPMDHVQMATILRHCDGTILNARDAWTRIVDMQAVAAQASCTLEALAPLRAEAWKKAFGG